MRSSRLSLVLTAAVAFGGAWAGRAWIQSRDGTAAGRGTGSFAGNGDTSGFRGTGKSRAESRQHGPDGALAVPGSAGAAGVMRDPLVRKAVEGADLIAGVKEIMARQGEDHCADTRLVCLVENLPADRLSELPALLEHFETDIYVMKFVLGPWAKRDPAAALAWVEAHPSLNASGVNAFLSGWTRGDPKAALAWVDEQPVSARGAVLRTALVDAISEKDPAGALELMQSKGWIANSPDAVMRLLQNWGGRDPAGALDGLRSLTGSMGLNLSEANSGTAGRTQGFQTLLKALLYGAFQNSPQEAMALVSRLNPSELSIGSQAVAQEVLARDPAFTEQLFARQQDPVSRRLLLSLAETGSPTVFANIGRITDPSLRQEMLVTSSSGGSGYSSDNPLIPDAAIPSLRSAVAEMTDATAMGRVSQKLAEMTAASNPAFASELWAGMSKEQQLSGPLIPFFRKMGAADPGAALAAYEASEPEVRTDALKVLASSLAGSDPQAGLGLVLQQANPAARAESGATLLAYWAQKDPAQAMAALETHAGDFDLALVEQGLSKAGSFESSYRSEYNSISINQDLRQKLSTLREAAGGTEGGTAQ